MAKLLEAFDSDQHEEMSDFEPVPAATYPVQITNSDLCDTKAKDGKYVKLEFSSDNGDTWETIDILENTGSFDWIVPYLESDQGSIGS